LQPEVGLDDPLREVALALGQVGIAVEVEDAEGEELLAAGADAESIRGVFVSWLAPRLLVSMGATGLGHCKRYLILMHVTGIDCGDGSKTLGVIQGK
jgi:hypothetical protein